MQQLEKNVEKQLIIRTYEPDMATLKTTVKQLMKMQDLTLNLYGQSGEVLISIKARAHAKAAATELTESVATRLEEAIGDAAYGRGKGSIAYVTAGELIENEQSVVAADKLTGAILSEEFSHTKRGNDVFDFGEDSYKDEHIVEKIKTMAEKNFEEDDIAQKTAAHAVAAAKCARAEFGVSMMNLRSDGMAYLAVAYKGYVYMRRFPKVPDRPKRMAMAALDLLRRLAKKLPTGSASVFKANTDFDWNEPIDKKPVNPYVAPVMVLAGLLIALGIACWYFFSHFSLGTPQNDLPVDTQSTPQSISQMQPEGDAQGPAAPGGEIVPESQPEAQTNTTDPVRPFA